MFSSIEALGGGGAKLLAILPGNHSQMQKISKFLQCLSLFKDSTS
jgi:hypothetical protein